MRRCAERRQALAAAVASATKGDLADVAQRAAFVATSSVADVRAGAAKLLRAHQRLKR